MKLARLVKNGIRVQDLFARACRSVWQPMISFLLSMEMQTSCSHSLVVNTCRVFGDLLLADYRRSQETTDY